MSQPQSAVVESVSGGRRPSDEEPSKRHVIRWVAGIVVVALIALAVVLATRPPNQAASLDSPLVGKPAPPIVATAFNGAHVSLAADRGRYVVINFFASWCPPCQEEEPNLVDFAFEQTRSPDPAVLLSVDIDDTVSAGRAFVDRWGATWANVPDRGGAIASAYGVASPPMTFLVDPRGVILAAWAGPITASQLESKLAAAREGNL